MHAFDSTKRRNSSHNFPSCNSATTSWGLLGLKRVSRFNFFGGSTLVTPIYVYIYILHLSICIIISPTKKINTWNRGISMWSSPCPWPKKKSWREVSTNSPRDGCSCCYDYLIDCSLTRHPWNVYLKTIQHGDPASTHITTTNSRRHVEHQTQKRLRWIPRSSRDFFTFTFQIHFQMLHKSCLVAQWRDRKDHWTMPKLRLCLFVPGTSTNWRECRMLEAMPRWLVGVVRCSGFPGSSHLIRYNQLPASWDVGPKASGHLRALGVSPFW